MLSKYERILPFLTDFVEASDNMVGGLMLRHTTLDATCQANLERSEQLAEEVIILLQIWLVLNLKFLVNTTLIINCRRKRRNWHWRMKRGLTSKQSSVMTIR